MLTSARGYSVGADWLTALKDVGGRFVPAARGFLDSQVCAPRAAGVECVRWLAERLEQHFERDDDLIDEDRFVEGAGALLGLLLIDHWGGRITECDGRHLVQIGRFGCFDPFEAIQEALDAEDPRRCLSSYLGIAEREASGNGPVSRVIGLFADALRDARPDLRIESQFELTVYLNNGASVDLARLERVARDQDDDATAEAAKRIVGMLPGAGDRGPKITSWASATNRILPRLVSEDFLRSLPSEQRLHAEPLGADVHLALQLRYAARARYLMREEVGSWPIEPGAAAQRAIQNLADRSRTLRIEQVAEGISCVRQGDGLDAARLLLPDLAARLAQLDASCDWLAAVPHRDILLLGSEHADEQLASLAEDAFRRAPHPISPALFTVAPQRPLPR